ncbi:hypothetical protein Tco_1208260, partial [Tanacetum coccineum]
MFDEYFPPPPKVVSRVLPAITPVNDNTTGTPSLTSINQDAPSASTSPTSTETQSPVISKGVKEQLQSAVDIVHPTPVAAFAFPAATVVRTLAGQGEVIRGIQERLLDMPTQRVRSLEVFETRLHGIVKDEREARERIER